MIINIVKSICVVVGVSSLAILMYVTYQQSEAIAKLEEKMQNQTADVFNDKNRNFIPVDQLAKENSLNDSRIQTLIEQQTNVTGTIIIIDGDIITIRASVLDIEELTKIDTLHPFVTPFVEKTFLLKTTPGTVFLNKTLSELEVGDTIKVISPVSIFTSTSGTIEAINLTFFDTDFLISKKE